MMMNKCNNNSRLYDGAREDFCGFTVYNTKNDLTHSNGVEFKPLMVLNHS